MNEIKGFKLYADPSFLEGLARLVDPMGTLNEYNTSQSNEEADGRALLSDWEAVGDEIVDATEKLAEETEAQTTNGK